MHFKWGFMITLLVLFKQTLNRQFGFVLDQIHLYAAKDGLVRNG